MPRAICLRQRIVGSSRISIKSARKWATSFRISSCGRSRASRSGWRMPGAVAGAACDQFLHLSQIAEPLAGAPTRSRAIWRKAQRGRGLCDRSASGGERLSVQRRRGNHIGERARQHSPPSAEDTRRPARAREGIQTLSASRVRQFTSTRWRTRRGKPSERPRTSRFLSTPAALSSPGRVGSTAKQCRSRSMPC